MSRKKYVKNGKVITLWLDERLPKEKRIQLKPVEWRVRWAVLVCQDNYDRAIFNRRLRRAIREHGIKPVVVALKKALQNPTRLMLPDKIYGTFREHRIIHTNEVYTEEQKLSYSLLQALGEFDPMVPEIIHVIGSEIKRWPAAVAWALSFIKDQEALPYAYRLFKVYGKSNEILAAPWVRPGLNAYLAVNRLPALIAKIEKKRALPFLRRVVLGSYDDSVKQYTIEALAGIDCLETVLLCADILKTVPARSEEARKVRVVLEKSRCKAAQYVLDGRDLSKMLWYSSFLGRIPRCLS